jgi:hypothetical protein
LLTTRFQGGEDTFGDLPQTLDKALAPLHIVRKSFVFKSQGDLTTCVRDFREWYCLYLINSRHENQVLAIEREKQSPTPTVKTVLICHSMGGIVAVDSLLSMIDEQSPSGKPLWPEILGIIAYDTPYLGLNPPVFHRTISTRVNAISSAVNTAREWIPPNLFKSSAVATPKQQSKWGLGKTIAAGTAAVAAVGALSYYAKDPVINHLQFVKVLYASEDLAARMRRISSVNVGFAIFYTVVTYPSDDGGERTFCNLPKERGGIWIRQENGVAKDEVEAHCGMFSPGENDHFGEMVGRSVRLIKEWIGAME